MVEHVAYDQFVGATLGSYQLDQIVEQHAWGPIFKASSGQGANYIVRFIDTPLANTHSGAAADAHIVYLGRFQQEANRVSALQHPHILPLLDYGNYQGIPYLVYQYASLVPLRAWLMQKAARDLRTIGLFLDQIASALTYAHERAVLHRNLSTNCIFVQSDRHMLVSEFGLMHMYASGQSDSYTGSTESCAPEQLRGELVDTATDIYALGAVLHRLLTGRPPFTGKTREAIMQQHLCAPVPSLKTRRPELPAQLDTVLATALAKEPQQRYHTPGDLTQAYYQSIAAGRVPTAPEKPVLPPPRRRFIMFIALGTSAGIGTLAVLFVSRLLPSEKTVKQATSVPDQNNRILARVADIPINSAKTFAIESRRNPGLIIHLPDDRFVAFDSTCTHQGCAVEYSPGESVLQCPCHNAVFDPSKDASVVSGPASTPLTSLKITVNADGTITAV